ncbi:MAG: RHS repeat-associated core domain-containing protein [Bacteroidales bacterium]
MKIHYHPDHLGSASFVTNIGGGVVQLLQYLPYGELFVSQRNSEEFDSRYKFTAKELDNETSYTYFGARYYDSELSGWLSVDPMSDKYPSTSAYMYCGGNPVRLIDPNGMDWYENNETGEVAYQKDYGENDAHLLGENWSWMGKNDMFGKNPSELYNKFYGIENNEEYVAFGFNKEYAKKFMGEQGYKQVPNTVFIYEKSQSIIIPGMPGTSQSAEIGEKVSIFEGIHYTKKENNTYHLGERLNFKSKQGFLGSSETFSRYKLNYSTDKYSGLKNTFNNILNIGNSLGSGRQNWVDEKIYYGWENLDPKFNFLKDYKN